MKESYTTEGGLAPRLQPVNITNKNMRRRKDCTRVISFTSGKGGVGKTNMTINLAASLAKQGNTVLILDADLGLANVDILLGITPKYTLQDVLSGEKSIEDVIVDGPTGVSVIPSASGIESLCNLGTDEKMLLMDAIENISLEFDYLLIDTRAGISSDVMFFNAASGEIFVVINNEPTSLTDAYAVIKVLANNYGEKTFSVISNDVTDAREGLQAFERLQRSVDRFLKVRLSYLGHVPSDSMVNEAVRSQRALIEIYPCSKAGLAVSTIARKVDDGFQLQKVKGGMQFFFKKLLNLEINQAV